MCLSEEYKIVCYLLISFYIMGCEYFLDFFPPEVKFISPRDGDTTYLPTQN